MSKQQYPTPSTQPEAATTRPAVPRHPEWCTDHGMWTENDPAHAGDLVTFVTSSRDRIAVSTYWTEHDPAPLLFVDRNGGDGLALTTIEARHLARLLLDQADAIDADPSAKAVTAARAQALWLVDELQRLLTPPVPPALVGGAV